MIVNSGISGLAQNIGTKMIDLDKAEELNTLESIEVLRC